MNDFWKGFECCINGDEEIFLENKRAANLLGCVRKVEVSSF
jgi:hypothetical protein